ncbi:MAG TPA: hypothetical protein VEC12_02940 [Bacteroidia bacterium]|nr:hypothetical protein [Bacteroidia bacterium]
MKKLIYLLIPTLLLSACKNDRLLKRFNELEKQFQQTGNNIDNKNKDILEAFASDNFKRPKKVGPLYEKAQQADSITKEFLSYVDDLMKIIEQGAGGRAKNGEGLKNNDDIKAHKKLLIEQGKGAMLKQKINNTRIKLLSLLDEEDKKKVKTDLIATDNSEKNISWETELFENSPSAAVLVLLQKVKNDAKNTEAQVLELLAKSIDKNSQTFNKVEVRVIPKAGCVTKGVEFEAEIMLVAYSTNQEYEVVVDGQRFKSVNGIVDYKKIADATGNQILKGYMEVSNNGEIMRLPFENQYVVNNN